VAAEVVPETCRCSDWLDACPGAWPSAVQPVSRAHKQVVVARSPLVVSLFLKPAYSTLGRGAEEG
jgi:hypothetical protein